MGIEFVCPACQDTLRVGPDAAGRVVRCGSCMATLRVPVPPVDFPPPDDPPPFPRRRRADDPPPLPPDEYHRPARRRRRTPPPSAGRGPLFWTIAVLGLVAFLTLAACGGLVALLQPKWRPHESPAGGFRVDLPADPRDDMAEQVAVDNPAGARVEGTVLPLDDEVYAVAYWDLDPVGRRLVTDAALLEQAVKGLEAEAPPGGRVARGGKVLVSGFPAQDVAVTLAGGEGSVACRVVVAGPRLFLLSAGGGRTPADRNPNVRRFLDSFAVTDARLLAGRDAPRPKDPLGPVLDLVRKQKVRDQQKAGRPPAPKPPPDPDPDDEPAPAPDRAPAPRPRGGG